VRAVMFAITRRHDIGAGRSAGEIISAAIHAHAENACATRTCKRRQQLKAEEHFEGGSMFTNNPAFAKTNSGEPKTIVVEPRVELIDGDLHLIFTPEDLAKAKTFRYKSGQESRSAGFRVETSVLIPGEGRFKIACKWLGISIL
jgi:hypothetical protein